MPAAETLIAQWLALPHAAAADRVRQLVKQHDASARKTWAALRDHPVLAGRVRGILSALRAETRGTRDEVMWLMWINQARQELNPLAADDGGGEDTLGRAPHGDADEPAETDAAQQSPITLKAADPPSPRAVSTVVPLVFQAPQS